MVPPDGGWGWTVVFGCFVIHFIMDGLIYSFGLFYIEFLEYFGTDRGTTSLVGSLQSGVNLFAGPIASGLINKYGTRVVAISGAILSAVGYIVSSFAENIYWLIVSFGLVPGVGNAFLFVAGIVTVGQYFSDKRSLAMGIAVCGSGIGGFMLAPLTTYLIDVFSWRGAVLIEGGLMLNCILAGALFRPLDLNSGELASVKEKEILLPDKGEEYISEYHKLSNSSLHRLAKSDSCIGSKSRPVSNLQTMSLTKLYIPKCNNFETKHLPYLPGSDHLVSSKSQPEVCAKGINSDGKLKTLFRTFFQILGLSLCKSPAFILYVISNSCTSLSAGTTLTYLPDRAKDSGIHEAKVSLLLSVMGITNTITRVIFGWISAQKIANPSIIYCGALLIIAVVTPFVAIVDDFAFLLSYSIIFGICYGIYVLLMAIVLVEFVGIDQLNNSFGLMLLFKGIAVVAGTPVIGWLYDVTGSYDASFYTAGTIMLISAITFSVGYVFKIRLDKANEK